MIGRITADAAAGAVERREGRRDEPNAQDAATSVDGCASMWPADGTGDVVPTETAADKSADVGQIKMVLRESGVRSYNVEIAVASILA